MVYCDKLILKENFTDILQYQIVFTFQSTHSTNKLLIPFKLIANVDTLWNSAEVVGIRTPATPKTIRLALIPTIKL